MKISSFLTFFFVINFFLNSFSQEISNTDIENSIIYLQKKATLKYSKLDGKIYREIYLKGFRINEFDLANLLQEKDLLIKINQKNNQRRLLWGAVSVLGLPTGIYLSFISARDIAEKIKNNDHNQFISTQDFFIGSIGSIITIFGVIYSIMLINDFLGLDSVKVLEDKTVESLIKRYNNNLKSDISDNYYNQFNYFPLFKFSKNF